jgi:hypothetical protein
VFDFDSKAAIKTHKLICRPSDSEKRENVTAPIINQQLKSGENQQTDCHPMTETVFAGENVKKFALKKIATVFAFFDAIFARLTENFFLRYRPSNRSGDQPQNKNPENLFGNRHPFLRERLTSVLARQPRFLKANLLVAFN